MASKPGKRRHTFGNLPSVRGLKSYRWWCYSLLQSTARQPCFHRRVLRNKPVSAAQRWEEGDGCWEQHCSDSMPLQGVVSTSAVLVLITKLPLEKNFIIVRERGRTGETCNFGSVPTKAFQEGDRRRPSVCLCLDCVAFTRV